MRARLTGRKSENILPPILRLVHEKLARSLAIIERFGFIRVRGSENDKSHVVACVTATAAVVFAVGKVEAVAGSHGGTAFISFRVAHCQKVRRVNRYEQLEVNLARRKFIGKLREKPPEITARRMALKILQTARSIKLSLLQSESGLAGRRVVGNALSDIRVAIVADRVVGSLCFRLYDIISVQVGFGVVIGSNI